MKKAIQSVITLAGALYLLILIGVGIWQLTHPVSEPYHPPTAEQEAMFKQMTRDGVEQQYPDPIYVH